MAPRRRLLPALAGIVILALAACSSPGSSTTPVPTATPVRVTPVPTPMVLSAFPSGFPTAYTDQRPKDLPLLSTVPGGLRGHITGTLASGDLAATYTASWIENRVPAASVTCAGKTYTNLFTVTDPTVTSDVTFPGWGTGTLLATRRVVVYASSINGSSPPICEDQGGGTFTLTFDEGPVPGILSGTWKETPDGAVTLSLPSSPSP
jgi:hypothetical protein